MFDFDTDCYSMEYVVHRDDGSKEVTQGQDAVCKRMGESPERMKDQASDREWVINYCKFIRKHCALVL